MVLSKQRNSAFGNGVSVAAWFVLLGSVMLTSWGCAGSGERFAPAVVTQRQAVIYVYRPSSTFRGAAVSVVVNGDEMGRLRNGEFVARVVDAGEHFVRAQSEAESTIAVRVVEGESAYVQIRVSKFGSVPRLVVLETGRARKEIARTRSVVGTR